MLMMKAIIYIRENKMSNKKILITGGSGYLGKNIIQNLSKKYEIKYLTRNLNDKSRQSIFIKNNFHSINAAVGKFKPDLVLHLASLFIVNHKSKDINNLIDSNIKFGSFLLESMKLNKIDEIINIGTSWEYKNSHDYNPVNLYAATKNAYEKILFYYYKTMNLKILNLKLYDTYGPSDDRGKIISKIIESVKSEKKLKLSPGNQILDIIHINDLIDAIKISLEIFNGKQRKFFKTYSLLSKERYKLKDIVKIILESTKNRKNNIILGGLPYRENEVFVPSTNIKKLPKWSPKIKFVKGIKDLINE